MVTTRIKDLERERIWAIAAAHSEGLSIRKIAEITGLSSSRVHQLLHTDEARQIPDWLLSGQDQGYFILKRDKICSKPKLHIRCA